MKRMGQIQMLIQPSGPIGLQLLKAELLGGNWIADSDKTVVPFLIADTSTIHLSGQPLTPVETDINTKRIPALHAHVEQAKLRMQVVVVKMRALASLQHQFDLLGLMIAAHRVTQTGFDCRKDGNQAFFDFIALDYFPSQLVFGNSWIAQVLNRPSGHLCSSISCCFDLGCGLFGKELKILELYSTVT